MDTAIYSLLVLLTLQTGLILFLTFQIRRTPNQTRSHNQNSLTWGMVQFQQKWLTEQILETRRLTNLVASMNKPMEFHQLQAVNPEEQGNSPLVNQMQAEHFGSDTAQGNDQILMPEFPEDAGFYGDVDETPTVHKGPIPR